MATKTTLDSSDPSPPLSWKDIFNCHFTHFPRKMLTRRSCFLCMVGWFEHVWGLVCVGK